MTLAMAAIAAAAGSGAVATVLACVGTGGVPGRGWGTAAVLDTNASEATAIPLVRAATAAPRNDR
jgi:hypothetical protein